MLEFYMMIAPKYFFPKIFGGTFPLAPISYTYAEDMKSFGLTKGEDRGKQESTGTWLIHIYQINLVPVADLPDRRALRSAGTSRLSVPSVRLSTVGSRACPVAGPRIWNALPQEMTSAVAVFVPSASEVAPLQTIVSRPRLLMFLLFVLLRFS